MRYLLFLPAIICFSLGFIGALSRAAREERKQREADRRRAEKAEAAARAKAEREARKAEADAACAVAAQAPRRKPGRPRKVQPVTEPAAAPVAEPIRPETISAAADPEPAQPEPASETTPATISAALAACGVKGNNAFAGHVVAFTGTLKNMTRAEAIEAVQANGGKAFHTMPAATTLLVVGENPGMGKMDKADEWIGHTRKITQQQFEIMLKQPLTLDPEQFAKVFA